MEKSPAIIPPDVETVSESGDTVPDSDQDPPAAAAVYTQPHTGAVEAGQASNKHLPDLTKPSTCLPTHTVTQTLHLPIDNVQVVWCDHFLNNMDIQSDVYLKH